MVFSENKKTKRPFKENSQNIKKEVHAKQIREKIEYIELYMFKSNNFILAIKTNKQSNECGKIVSYNHDCGRPGKGYIRYSFEQ